MRDFLYSDHERVAALVSQIEGVGALVGYQSTHQKDKSKGSSVKGAVPLISAQADRSTNYHKQLRQEYDPLWRNSSTLIDTVASRQSDAGLGTFEYGKLLTVSGELLCVDQALFNNLLKSPAIIDQIASGIDQDVSERSSKVKQKERRELADIIREFVQSLPLGVVFFLFTKETVFWFNVKREYLQLQSLDIPLKFPVQIGGTWHVTGIVDAVPADYGNFTDKIDTFGNKRVLNQGFTIIGQIIAPLVGLFGRPADTFGLSPITIHREISF